MIRDMIWNGYTRCMAIGSRNLVYAVKKRTIKVDPLDYVNEMSMTSDKGGMGIMKNVTASGWTVVMVISVIGFVFSVIWCGFRLMIHPKEAEDVKKHIIAKSLMFMGVCCGAFLFSSLIAVAKGLFGL